MLGKLKALRQVVTSLIEEVDGWFYQKAAEKISPIARQRCSFLRYELRRIFRLQQELEELVPDSVVEAALQQPVFWLKVELDVAVYMDEHPELDIIQLNLYREGTVDKPNPQRAIFSYSVMLEELY